MRGDAFDTRRAARTAGGRASHAIQVGHRFVVQLQSSRNGPQYLLRRMPFAALFQARVVIGAHHSERGDLLTAQTGHPATTGERNSHVFGAQSGTPCAEEPPSAFSAAGSLSVSIRRG